MGVKRYYAVREGKVRGVFGTWEECRASVEEYPGAEYKGFARREEAEDYLRGEKRTASGEKKTTGGEKGTAGREKRSVSGEKKTAGGEKRTASGETGAEAAPPQERPEPGTLLAYVDGSYDDALKKYAFGCVFLLPEGTVRTVYGNGEKEEALKHRNVSGEMLGAMYAVRTAMASGYGKVELRYDYEGIEKWVTGEWRTKTELTGVYARSMREWGQQIHIRFTKVPAHSNVYYNELADGLAKRGLREGQGTPRIRSLAENRAGD